MIVLTDSGRRDIPFTEDLSDGIVQQSGTDIVFNFPTLCKPRDSAIAIKFPKYSLLCVVDWFMSAAPVTVDQYCNIPVEATKFDEFTDIRIVRGEVTQEPPSIKHDGVVCPFKQVICHRAYPMLHIYTV